MSDVLNYVLILVKTLFYLSAFGLRPFNFYNSIGNAQFLSIPVNHDFCDA